MDFMQSFKRKFVKDVSWTMGSTVIKSAGGIIINVMVGNFYNADGLGIFNQALAIYIILSTISVFGLQNAVVKYTAQYKEKKPDEIPLLTSTALVSAFCFALIIPILFYLAVYLFPAILEDIRLMPALANILIALPFFSANKVLMGLANGMRRMKLFAAVRSMRWLLVIAFIGLSYFTHQALSFCLLAFPFTELILFLWQFFYLRKFYRFTFRISGKWGRELLAFGSKTVLTGAISELNGKLDILMIRLFLGDFQVGIYSLAASIARGFIMLASVVSTNFNPFISALWEKKEITLLKDHISKLRKISALIFLPLLTISAVIFPFFLEIAMKTKSFGASTAVYLYLLPGIAVVTIFHWCGGLLSMAGYPGQSIKVGSLTLVFNALANALLIPLMGINGAAVATSCANILLIVLQRYFIKRILHLDIFEKLGIPEKIIPGAN